MRPFRAIPIDGSKKFVYGGYIELEDEHYIIPDTASICYGVIIGTSHYDFIEGFVKVIPETVGQSTGLTDKNGKEIYGEGDIYKDANGIISIVKMAVDGWALFPIKKETPVRNLYWHNVCDKTKGVIIGTIHTHPELMEKLK